MKNSGCRCEGQPGSLQITFDLAVPTGNAYGRSRVGTAAREFDYVLYPGRPGRIDHGLFRGYLRERVGRGQKHLCHATHRPLQERGLFQVTGQQGYACRQQVLGFDRVPYQGFHGKFFFDQGLHYR